MGLSDGGTDVIPCDKYDAGDGPQLDEDHPQCVAEGTLVVVGHAHSQLVGGLLPGVEDEGGGHDVLYARPRVAARDAHQQLQAVRGQRDGGGRDEGQQGEDGLAGPVGVPAALSQEQGLEVVTQRDGDDGEVGAEGEHWEECQEDVQSEEKPGVGRRGLEVESVEISDGRYSHKL